MVQVAGIQTAGIILIIVISLLPEIIAPTNAECDTDEVTGFWTCESTNADLRSIMDIVWLIGVIVGSLMIDVTRYVYRGKIANKYGVKFGTCPDYFLVCCCPQCSLVQEAKVVTWGGPNKPGVGGKTVIGQPVGSNA